MNVELGNTIYETGTKFNELDFRGKTPLQVLQIIVPLAADIDKRAGKLLDEAKALGNYNRHTLDNLQEFLKTITASFQSSGLTIAALRAASPQGAAVAEKLMTDAQKKITAVRNNYRSTEVRSLQRAQAYFTVAAPAAPAVPVVTPPDGSGYTPPGGSGSGSGSGDDSSTGKAEIPKILIGAAAAIVAFMALKG